MANVANVFAAQPVAAGSLHSAPKGTTLPVTARSALASPWIDQGFIGEDGFTQSENRATDKKYAFGGKLVKVLQKEYTVTLKFSFMESINAVVLKSVYGAENVTIGSTVDTGEIIVTKNSKPAPHAAWVVDVLDGDALQRTVVPDGQITEIADIKKLSSDVIVYTVTLDCFEDASGNNLYEYSAVGAAVAPGP